jgi:hypothetical protein
MINILLAAALHCPAPTIENKTWKWVPRDEEMVRVATRRCKEEYPNSPCLVRFVKIAEGRWSAVCGSPK